MSTTVTYKGETLTTVNNQTRTLETAGTYLEDDITLVDVSQSAPVLQAKTNIAPSISSQTITADAGYDGLSSVQINAISPRRTSNDVVIQSANVTVAYGYYPTQVSKSVSSGTQGTPTATKGTVSNNTITVTPSVTNTAGWITGGTQKGTAVLVSASELVSGTKSITENGTGIDVANYASVDVNVSGGGGSSELFVFVDSTGYHSSDVVFNGSYGTTLLAYTYSGLAQGDAITVYTWGDYILDTVTGRTSGQTISYTTVQRGTYTFTMPNESVYCTLLYDD